MSTFYTTTKIHAKTKPRSVDIRHFCGSVAFSRQLTTIVGFHAGCFLRWKTCPTSQKIFWTQNLPTIFQRAIKPRRWMNEWTGSKLTIDWIQTNKIVAEVRRRCYVNREANLERSVSEERSMGPKCVDRHTQTLDPVDVNRRVQRYLGIGDRHSNVIGWQILAQFILYTCFRAGSFLLDQFDTFKNVMRLAVYKTIIIM